MKKTIILFILFLFIANSIYSQDIDRNYSIQIFPLPLISNIFNINNDPNIFSYSFSLEFQYKLNNYWNILLRPNFFINSYKKGTIFIYDDFFSSSYRERDYFWKNTIFSIMPGVLFRLFGTGLRGMYIGIYPNIGWQNVETEYLIHYFVDYDSIDINDNYFLLGIGTEIGYNWLFKNGFTITLGGGIGKNWGIPFKNNSGYLEIMEENSFIELIRISFMLGYSF
jgi:hypothetical protein